MGLIETILKLTVQIFIWAVELTLRLISGLMGALWSAWVNRAPNRQESPLKRAVRPPHKRGAKWRHSRN